MQFFIILNWIWFIIWFYFRYDKIKTNKSYAICLKNKLENLGIIGIKLGQYLCGRYDISTQIMRDELKVFLNDNKIHSLEHTINILNKSKLLNLDELMIGDIIGSGSLTQVYSCYYKPYNKQLVIKVKHPETCNLETELKALKKLIKFASCFQRVFSNIDWHEYFNMLEIQLDLLNEKKYLELYHSIYESNTSIEVPKYICGNSDFIMMTFCQGKPLNEISKSDKIYAKAHNLFVSSFIHTFFNHKIVHGDIHEGNILVKDNGDISIIDFGICVELGLEQYLAIYSMSLFTTNPSLKTCYLLKYLAHSVTSQKTDLIANDIYLKFTRLFQKNEYISIGKFFEMIINDIPKYGVIFRGNCLSFFMNIILLEGLSPHDQPELTLLIALSYMKKEKFFMSDIVDDYYNDAIKQLSEDKIKLLNNYIL